MTHINKITNFRKMETLRYRDKTGFIGKGNRNKSRRGIKGGL